jgi:hypothetical protein
MSFENAGLEDRSGAVEQDWHLRDIHAEAEPCPLWTVKADIPDR